MKLEDLVGKFAIRTEARTSDQPALLGGGRSLDASFCTQPVKIEEVVNGIVFYRDGPDQAVRVLSPIYKDANWAAFPERLLEGFWRSKPGPEKDTG